MTITFRRLVIIVRALRQRVIITRHHDVILTSVVWDLVILSCKSGKNVTSFAFLLNDTIALHFFIQIEAIALHIRFYFFSLLCWLCLT